MLFCSWVEWLQTECFGVLNVLSSHTDTDPVCITSCAVHTCAHAHTCIHTHCAHACVYTQHTCNNTTSRHTTPCAIRARTHTHTHTHTHTTTCMLTHVHTHTHAHTHTHMHIHTHMRRHTHTPLTQHTQHNTPHTHTHTQTHTQRSSVDSCSTAHCLQFDLVHNLITELKLKPT